MSQVNEIKGLRYGEFQGFPALLIDTPHAKAAISLFGAHVMSYTPKGAQDLLWMSAVSKHPPEGIRGGIPICWPWFAKQGQSADAQQHGLVRRVQWSMTRAAQHEDGTIDLNFSPAVGDVHPLTINLSMRIGRRLAMALTTVNLTEQSYELTQAFHTYFRVGDVRQVGVTNLEGVRYSDKFDDMASKLQAEAFQLPLDAPCSDRIYHDVAGDYTLHDPLLSRSIRLTSEHSKTLVVWNPGAMHVKGFTDIDHEAWPGYLCLEVANAGEDVINLAPNESAQLIQTISLE